MRFDDVHMPVGNAPSSNGPLVALIVVGVLLAISFAMVLGVMSWLKSPTPAPADAPTSTALPSKKTSRPAQQGR